MQVANPILSYRRCQECLTLDEEKKAVTCRSTASSSHVHQNILYNTVLYISVHVFPLHCNLRPFSHKLIRMAMGYGMLGVLPGCLSPRTWAISRLRLRRSLQFVQAIQANEMITWPWHFHAFCSISLHFGKRGLLHRKNWISDTLQLQSQPGKCFPLSDITDNTTESRRVSSFSLPYQSL